MDAFTVPRVALRRIKGIAREQIYLSTGADFTRPESIRACLNHRCNFACQYCYSWQRPEYPELPIDQWQKALGSLRHYIGKYLIQFSGGEPFIKRGFIDLLEYCHSHEIEWGVITNGSAFSQKIVERVVAANPVNIDISVYSSSAQINDGVRGSDGALSKIEEGIKHLAAERAKNSRRFLIRIKPTITKQILSLPSRISRLGCRAGRGQHGLFSPVRPEQFWTPRHFADLWLNASEIVELESVVQELLRLRGEGRSNRNGPREIACPGRPLQRGEDIYRSDALPRRNAGLPHLTHRRCSGLLGVSKHRKYFSCKAPRKFGRETGHAKFEARRSAAVSLVP